MLATEGIKLPGYLNSTLGDGGRGRGVQDTSFSNLDRGTCHFVWDFYLFIWKMLDHILLGYNKLLIMSTWSKTLPEAHTALQVTSPNKAYQSVDRQFTLARKCLPPTMSVVQEKLTVSHAVNKLPDFHGTQERSCTFYKSVTLSWPEPVQSSPDPNTCISFTSCSTEAYRNTAALTN